MIVKLLVLFHFIIQCFSIDIKEFSCLAFIEI